MIICHKCGEEAYIKYNKHFVCKKHYNESIDKTFKDCVKNHRDLMVNK